MQCAQIGYNRRGDGMGFTIEDALRESKKRYKMTLLAGEEGCSNAMSWIQMVEDKTILQQLWGKELVVTTGLGFQSQEKGNQHLYFRYGGEIPSRVRHPRTRPRSAPEYLR